ncbi:Uncharacterised protein [Chlamydia trachomatis]|nr:Uncharacterised protein [Chlamydia trachomatis]
MPQGYSLPIGIEAPPWPSRGEKPQHTWPHSQGLKGHIHCHQNGRQQVQQIVPPPLLYDCRWRPPYHTRGNTYTALLSYSSPLLYSEK